MSDKDIRWEQRFTNYKKALKKISEVVDEYNLEDLRNLR